MLSVAQRIREEKLSVRRTEELVRGIASGSRESQAAEPGPSRAQTEEPGDELQEASRMVQEALSLPVKIKSSRRGGKMEIRFRRREELEALVALLTSGDDG
jgi:ParB family chromosome partitioning protein